MKIIKFQLAVVEAQTIRVCQYAEPMCVKTVNAAPCLWLLVDETLPLGERHVRMVQESVGPVQAPEFGEVPCMLGFRYVGTCWHPAVCWHVFVEI